MINIILLLSLLIIIIMLYLLNFLRFYLINLNFKKTGILMLIKVFNVNDKGI